MRRLPVMYSKAACVARLEKLLAEYGQQRLMVGIAGAPGSGKSRLAKQLRQRFSSCAALVPMDGFHLPLTELDRLGRRDRQGAPDTFDTPGFVDLLRRIRRRDAVVKAPSFRRDRGEPLANAITVSLEKQLIIVEGNYLLLPKYGFEPVVSLLDETWFIDTPEIRRRDQLTQRHIRFGAAPEAAYEWTMGPDERNAALVARTAINADYLVRIG